MNPIYWLIAAGVFIILEIITLGLTTIWFAGGCVAAFIADVFGAPLIVQIVLCLVVSILLFIFTRPIVEKHLNHNREKTNVEGIVGKRCKVVEQIDNFNQKGVVMIDGIEWTARNYKSDEIIEVGKKVIVKEVKGAHVEVKVVD